MREIGYQRKVLERERVSERGFLEREGIRERYLRESETQRLSEKGT